MKAIQNRLPLRSAGKAACQRASRTTIRSMASLTVYVKGDPQNNVLGDCPFSHRVLLTLEGKSVPYTRKLIDLNNKPEWLQDKAQGKVPVINDGEFWLPDSDAIAAWLEEQYPEPSFKSDVPAEVGGKAFPSFVQFLKSTSEEAAEKEAALLQELKVIDEYLSKNGPLFGGATLNATDASLAPKLYHTKVALKHYKGWEIPAEFAALLKYYDALNEQPAWKNSLYGEDIVITGWAKHFA